VALRDEVGLDLVLDGLDALAGVGAARAVEDALVELVGVQLLGRRLQRRAVALVPHLVLLDGELGRQPGLPFDVDDLGRRPQGALEPGVAVGRVVERGMAGDGHHDARGDLRVDEGPSHDGDLLPGHGRLGHEPHEVLAEHLGVQRLGALELPFQLAAALAADAPDLRRVRVLDRAVLPDADKVVLDVGADPDVGGAEDGLRPQGGARQVDGLLVDGAARQAELEGDELEDLGRPALLDVRLRLVHRHGAGHRAERSVMGLLHQVALVLQAPELPLDEPPVAVVDRGAVAPLVDQEPEGLPVVVRVHAREVVHDRAWVGEGFEGAVIAVGAQVLRLLAALDLRREGDGRDPGCMEPGGEEDLVARHPLEPREDVGVGEAPHVADVQEARDAGVGEVDEERRFRRRPRRPLGRWRPVGASPPRQLRVRRALRVVDLGVPPALLPLARDGLQVPFLHFRRPTGVRRLKVGGCRKGQKGRRRRWRRSGAGHAGRLSPAASGWRRCRRASAGSASRCGCPRP
jgi:hypothetical protein